MLNKMLLSELSFGEYVPEARDYTGAMMAELEEAKSESSSSWGLLSDSFSPEFEIWKPKAHDREAMSPFTLEPFKVLSPKQKASPEPKQEMKISMPQKKTFQKRQLVLVKMPKSEAKKEISLQDSTGYALKRMTMTPSAAPFIPGKNFSFRQAKLRYYSPGAALKRITPEKSVSNDQLTGLIAAAKPIVSKKSEPKCQDYKMKYDKKQLLTRKDKIIMTRQVIATKHKDLVVTGYITDPECGVLLVEARKHGSFYALDRAIDELVEEGFVKSIEFNHSTRKNGALKGLVVYLGCKKGSAPYIKDRMNHLLRSKVVRD